MSQMLKVVLAVAGGMLVTGKTLDAVRSHRCNKTMKAAQLPDRKEGDGADEDAAVLDDTGAYACALERPDGVQLYVREYIVHSGVQAKGLVVIVHGGGWHSGYFKSVAEHFNRKGLVVVTYDFRGHGLSGLVDGVRGYAADAYDWTEDLLAVLRHAQERHPGMPSFLLCESAGAVATLSLLTTKADEAAVKAVTGYVMASPVIRIAPHLLPPKAAMPLVRFLALAFPKAEVPGNKVGDTFAQAFPDQETADKCAADPLVITNPAIMRPAMGLMAAMERNYKPATELKTPFLLVHGRKDTRVEPEMSEKFYGESKAEDKKLLMYDDAYHQMFQDRAEVAERAMNDIADWILKHTTV